MSRISKVIEKVFSCNKNELYEERNISVTRLINVFQFWIIVTLSLGKTLN